MGRFRAASAVLGALMVLLGVAGAVGLVPEARIVSSKVSDLAVADGAQVFTTRVGFAIVPTGSEAALEEAVAGRITAIASQGDVLCVATDDGVLRLYDVALADAPSVVDSTVLGFVPQKLHWSQFWIVAAGERSDGVFELALVDPTSLAVRASVATNEEPLALWSWYNWVVVATSSGAVKTYKLEGDELNLKGVVILPATIKALSGRDQFRLYGGTVGGKVYRFSFSGDEISARELAEFSAPVVDVCAYDGKIHAALSNDRVAVLDSSGSLVATISVNDPARLAAAAGTLYVRHEDGGFAKFSVSDGYGFAGEFEWDETPTDAVYVGDRLFVACRKAGLRVFEGEGGRLEIKSTLPLADARSIKNYGSFIVVAAGENGVYMLDGLYGTVASHIDITGKEIVDAALVGDKVVAASVSPDELLWIEPATGSVLSTTPLPTRPVRIAARGSYVYVACGNGGLAIVDASGAELDAVTTFTLYPAYNVDIDGDVAVLASHYSGAVILDISSPAEPSVVSVVEPALSTTAAKLVGSTLVVGDRVGGVRYYDVSDPASPVEYAASGELDVAAIATGDEKAFVVGYDGDIDVFPLLPYSEAGVEEVVKMVGKVSAFPNPFNRATLISVTAAEDGDYTVEVVDLGGRVVRVLHSGALSRGTHTFVWEGKDDSGKPVPSGRYFVLVRSGSSKELYPVVLIK